MKPLNRLWNLAPRNPTQTAYTRFLAGPQGEIRTMFSDSRESFDKLSNQLLKTEYDKFWRGDIT